MSRKLRPPVAPPMEMLEKYVRVGMVSTGRAAWDTRGPLMRLEDWAPNYPGDRILVQFRETYDLPYSPLAARTWSVRVSGEDDLWMQYTTEDRGSALWRYEAIGDGVTRAALEESGFGYM